MESIITFQNVLADICDKKDPTISEIRNKIKVKNYYNSYLNLF